MPSMPPTHRGAGRPANSRQAYDQDRGGARARGYNGAWEKASAGHKAKHPWCRGCAAIGLRVAAAVTDHVVPGTRGTPEFWNSARWQSACKWHHDVVKQRLEDMYARGLASVADLWLDSPKAVVLTNRLGPPPGGA